MPSFKQQHGAPFIHWLKWVVVAILEMYPPETADSYHSLATWLSLI